MSVKYVSRFSQKDGDHQKIVCKSYDCDNPTKENRQHNLWKKSSHKIKKAIKTIGKKVDSCQEYHLNLNSKQINNSMWSLYCCAC